jgi:4-hydroxybenzoate polyprenyltransferase
MGFISFSLLSSIVYIINDLKDIEKDKNHSTKRNRPLPAGTISTQNAVIAIVVLFILLAVAVFSLRLSQNIVYGIGILGAYLLLNVLYSFGAKNIPIIDIVILASGYILRVVFGGLIINTGISFWLYLVITLGSFYIGFGKRRNEIIKQEKNTREVIKAYSYNFLDKNMYACQVLCIVFYAFWSIDGPTVQRLRTSSFVFTVPLVFLILLRYSFDIERNSDGDPVTVLLRDKALIALVFVYVAVSCIILYRSGVL